jgi:hypothetical protein
MSQANVELIERLYSWLAEGENQKAFEVYSPEIEFDNRGLLSWALIRCIGAMPECAKHCVAGSRLGIRSVISPRS